VDFKTRDGKLKQLLSCRMPLILGNELCGEVTEVGTQVSTVQVGDGLRRGWGMPSSAIPVRRCLRIFAEPGAR
jgi:D-arabinose 1-dehydrogenase-like Zn-dependent alcohol dehydrogenase